LSNRLGKERVVRPELFPDVLPEYALRWQPLLESATPGGPPAAGTKMRPLHLFAQPQLVTVVAVVPGGPPRRFDHQGRSHGIRQAWGPERLSAGWWRGGQVQRDYYRVETDAGQRFWLFRRIREGDWYLHGEFD
jgi:protein ImuB